MNNVANLRIKFLEKTITELEVLEISSDDDNDSIIFTDYSDAESDTDECYLRL